MQLLLQAHLHAQFGVEEFGQRFVEQEYRRIAHDGRAPSPRADAGRRKLARAALKQAVKFQNARGFFTRSSI